MSEFHKNCPKCNKEVYFKTAEALRRSLYRNSSCLSCRPRKRLSNEEKKASIEKVKEYKRKYHADRREHFAKKVKKTEKKLKVEVFKKYGGKCACCGESNSYFLTIDHIFGRHVINGKKENQTGNRLYRQVKKEGFPPIYQLLCYNCNCAKGILGYCPHKGVNNEMKAVTYQLLTGANTNTNITGAANTVVGFQYFATQFSASGSPCSGLAYVQGSIDCNNWFNIVSGAFTSASIITSQFIGPWNQIRGVVVQNNNPVVTGNFTVFVMAQG